MFLKRGNMGLKEFTARRFGVFIHWGLYAIPGGYWKGEAFDYIGEWIQAKFRIPNAEYSLLAREFNPVGFDAEEWIKAIRDAGARYIVYTAKHHEGFAMYHSHVSGFNIVDATPFGRDPLAELADACQKYGVGLGIYYSHNLDWHEPDGGDPGPDCWKNRGGISWGNDWDFPDYQQKDFNRYFEAKVLPQVTELLTNYGPVCEFWCDCFLNIKEEYSRRLREHIRKLQPECVINSRIGNGYGDFESLGDNQIVASRSAKPVECPLTLNDTWGYKYDDQNWKSPLRVVKLLSSLADRNANLLLNIGPEPGGKFPAPAMAILGQLARWHLRYPDVITGTGPNPFPQSFDWGYCTTRDNQLNFLITEWKREITVSGIDGDVIASSVPCSIADKILTLHLPERPTDELLPVITVTFAQKPQISPVLTPQNGVVTLVPAAGQLHHAESTGLEQRVVGLDVAAEAIMAGGQSTILRNGSWCDWHLPGESMSWQLHFPQGGRYTVTVETIQRYHGDPWVGGRKVSLAWQNQTRCAPLDRAEIIDDGCYPAGLTELGEISVDDGETGTFTITSGPAEQPKAENMCLASIRIKRKQP